MPPVVRVLVVDDSANFNAALSVMLRVHGHDVYTATDGANALVVGEEVNPHLVLLDLAMPVMSGFDTAALMKQSEWGKKARIVALTGVVDEAFRAVAEDAGFDGYYLKPLLPETLTTIIAGLNVPAQDQDISISIEP